jgi:hypothetical protein
MSARTTPTLIEIDFLAAAGGRRQDSKTLRDNQPLVHDVSQTGNYLTL